MPSVLADRGLKPSLHVILAVDNDSAIDAYGEAHIPGDHVVTGRRLSLCQVVGTGSEFHSERLKHSLFVRNDVSVLIYRSMILDLVSILVCYLSVQSKVDTGYRFARYCIDLNHLQIRGSVLYSNSRHLCFRSSVKRIEGLIAMHTYAAILSDSDHDRILQSYVARRRICFRQSICSRIEICSRDQSVGSIRCI